MGEKFAGESLRVKSQWVKSLWVKNNINGVNSFWAKKCMSEKVYGRRKVYGGKV